MAQKITTFFQKTKEDCDDVTNVVLCDKGLFIPTEYLDPNLKAGSPETATCFAKSKWRATRNFLRNFTAHSNKVDI